MIRSLRLLVESGPVKDEIPCPHHFEKVLTGEWRRLCRVERCEFPHQGPLFIEFVYCSLHFFVADGDTKPFFYLLFAACHFRAPVLFLRLTFRTLRDFENNKGFELLHELEHLLLAIAGCLTDDEFRVVEKRTFLCNCKPVGGFDQRTEVPGQVFFPVCNWFFLGGTEGDGHCSRSNDKFLRGKNTIEPDKLFTLIAYTLNRCRCIRDHRIKICHVFCSHFRLLVILFTLNRTLLNVPHFCLQRNRMLIVNMPMHRLRAYSFRSCTCASVTSPLTSMITRYSLMSGLSPRSNWAV